MVSIQLVERSPLVEKNDDDRKWECHSREIQDCFLKMDVGKIEEYDNWGVGS